MNKFILILMCVLIPIISRGQTLVSGAFMPIQTINNPTYEIIGKGIKSNNTSFINGKTYLSDKYSFSVVTSNSVIILQFSNGLISKIDTNSDFVINDFKQEISNTNTELTLAKIGEHILGLTLNKGEAELSFVGTKPNSTCSISTPLVDLELFDGKFYIRCDENSVYVFVLEGSLKCHGERGYKKIVKSGEMLTATPIQNPMKGISDKVFLGFREMTTDTTSNLLSNFKVATELSKKSIFIVIDGKIVGVNMN